MRLLTLSIYLFIFWPPKQSVVLPQPNSHTNYLQAPLHPTHTNTTNNNNKTQTQHKNYHFSLCLNKTVLSNLMLVISHFIMRRALVIGVLKLISLLVYLSLSHVRTANCVPLCARACPRATVCARLLCAFICACQLCAFMHVPTVCLNAHSQLCLYMRVPTVGLYVRAYCLPLCSWLLCSFMRVPLCVCLYACAFMCVPLCVCQLCVFMRAPTPLSFICRALPVSCVPSLTREIDMRSLYAQYIREPRGRNWWWVSGDRAFCCSFS